MNWTEFFFGWLIKGQYEVSMLDTFICLAEISIIFIIGCLIVSWWENKK